MKTILRIAALSIFFSLSANAYSEDAKHFEGKKFDNITDAVAVLKDYNQRFEDKMNGELDALALHEIHELSYTMEDAVAFITSTLYTVAEELEAVHQATEHASPGTVRTSGAKYLELSRAIID